jgi:hypothetical protein
MKKIIYITTISVAFILASCNWDDFGDLNLNPNGAAVPTPGALLTNAQLTIGGQILATQGAVYSQHVANKQYTSADNYQTINFATDGFYTGPLADLQKIIDLNTDEATKVAASGDGDNANQIAIAKIMLSWYYLHMTDRWGDLPYSQALKGVAVLKPVFDSQEEIYNGVFQTLKDAVASINPATDGSIKPVTGDIILDGDMDMWIKFANTIRLNAATRLSKINPTKAASEFALAVTAGTINAVNNSENISFKYLEVQTYENPYYNSFVTLGRKDWTIPDPMMNLMQTTAYTSPHLSYYAAGHPYKTQSGKLNVVADPRLPVYALPIANTTSTYIGMPFGLSEANAGLVPQTQVSFIGDAFRGQDSPAMIFTSAHVSFLLAEGRLNNWITTGTAQGYYEQGINASMDQYDVAIGAYLTNTEVAYDPTKALQQIITQKWIAIFPNGYEGWAEWRRTGFPALSPGQNALTPNGQIPRRQAYGTNEANLNLENYNAALSRQGLAQDDLTGRVWWDKP